jgi:hypothetical protein
MEDEKIHEEMNVLEKEHLAVPKELEETQNSLPSFEFTLPTKKPHDEDAQTYEDDLLFEPPKSKLTIPKTPLVEAEKSTTSSPNLEFTPPDEIPMDEDANAFGEALQFEPPKSELVIQKIDLKEPINTKISPPNLEFTLPDEIPMDEEAKAFGEALQFEPPKSELTIPAINPKKADKDTQSLPSLEFTLPDEIPMDEEAKAFGEALQFEPSISELAIPEAKQEIKEGTEILTKSTSTDFTSLVNSLKEEKMRETPIDPFEIIVKPKPKNNKVGFQEIEKGGLFFGIEKSNITEEKEKEKNTKGIFSLFNAKKAPLEKISPQNENSPIANIPTQEELPNLEAKVEQARSNLIERRKSRKKNRSKVQICPMCGKIAHDCTCGYMKSK